MTYTLLTSLKDADIPQLLSVHSLPDVSRFIAINKKKYFKFVTETENVFYYKVYENSTLIGSVHCQTEGEILYISLLIFPEFQNNGYGTKVIKDIIDGVLPLNFDSIEISIDKTNLPSLRLFEKVGFIKTSVDGGLINYTYTK